jgi:hypothetical protein
MVKWVYVVIPFLALLSLADAEMSHLEESVVASEDPMIMEAYESIDTIGVGFNLLPTSERSLQDIIDSAKPGTVTKIPSGHYKLKKTLHIDKNLTLVGEGTVVVDAQKKCRILKISDPKLVVKLKNIDFVNGKDCYGSAIDSAAKSLILKRCKFRNNVADEIAIIRNGRGDLNIVDSEISDNMAFDSIVVCENGKLKLENVLFHNNTAFRLCNCINISGTENKLDSELVIKNSTFSNNQGCETLRERCIYSVTAVCAHCANVSIENSKFESNIFDCGNGVVALGDCFSVLKNCSIHQNKATRIGLSLGLSITGGNTFIENCEISENQIPYELDWYGFDDILQGAGVQTWYDAKVVMKDCVIRGNRGLHAAGIHNKGNATLTLDNTTISDNIATVKGGGVLNEGTLILKNSKFSGNQAELGGAIFNAKSSTVILDYCTTFVGNKAKEGNNIFDEDGVVE